MKRCPKCNRVEADEQLKFCRLDGAPLVEDSAAAGESSPTRILPSSETAEAQSVNTEGGDSAAATRDFKQERSIAATPPKSFAIRLSQHKTVALVFVAAVIVAVGGGFYLYRGRNATPVDSIAVLPFVNESSEPNAEYLSDGMTESIINSLSQLPNLGVIARNSVFRYKGKDIDAPTIGHELNVRSVLTGRVLQRGGNLSISVELVDTTNNHQLWGQQYNRQLVDVFAVQEEIARDISEKLRVRLSGTEQLAKRPTDNLRAFQYYMQGRAYTQRRTREDLNTAISFFQKAIAEDSTYALAYAGLADAYDNLGSRSYIAPVEGQRRAEEYARTALSLDENLAEAHAVLGQVLIDFLPYNFSQGDSELRRAIQLSPSLAMAHQQLAISLARQGRLDETVVEIQTARDLDPLSSIIARQVALPYYLKRDFPRALESLRQANKLGPPFSASWEIGIYLENESLNETLTELETVQRERMNDPILIHSIGMVHAMKGERTAALKLIKQLEEMAGPSLSQANWIAKIYAILGEKDMVFSWLERGLIAGAIGSFFKDEPVWDPIRSDPRFADLLRRMGIPQ